MSDMDSKKRNSWCIVVADDHGPEYVPCMMGSATTAPVQYCGFGEPTTLLQRALHRAKQIAPATQIVATVREENRDRWEPALWFIPPERRFVSDSRMAASLTVAAAVLSIAAESLSDTVTILPARCYVSDEGKLCAALLQLQATLPTIPEGVGTLGMIDIDEGIDENYLVPYMTPVGAGLAVQAMTRQPTGWIARYLRQQGAMVASGILTGYAGTLAGHVFKTYPDLAKVLAKHRRAAPARENAVCADLYRQVPKGAPRALRWCPPLLPQRAYRVYRCGWRGLHTARAVARVSTSNPANIASVSPRWPGFAMQQGSRTAMCPDFAAIPVERRVDHGWID
jgi:mannose-1-phosphate guanylyltransferase